MSRIETVLITPEWAAEHLAIPLPAGYRPTVSVPAAPTPAPAGGVLDGQHRSPDMYLGPVVLAPNGAVLQGRLRILAVVHTKVPVQALVIFDVDPAADDSDAGRRRDG